MCGIINNMNEQEWLTSDNPQAMLSWFECDDSPPYGRKASDRKLRLFAVACCRQVWHLLTDECSRKAVEVAERFADGEATVEALVFARDAAWDAVRESAWDAVGDAARDAAREAAKTTARDAAKTAAKDAAWDIQVAMLREIIGNPFRPSSIESAWLTPTVIALAQTAYDERSLPDGNLDTDTLAVLADALEEAGCPDETCSRCRGNKVVAWVAGSAQIDIPDEKGLQPRMRHFCPKCVGSGRTLNPILTHLRSRGPHVRGCWVLDLILGKS